MVYSQVDAVDARSSSQMMSNAPELGGIIGVCGCWKLHMASTSLCMLALILAASAQLVAVIATEWLDAGDSRVMAPVSAGPPLLAATVARSCGGLRLLCTTVVDEITPCIASAVEQSSSNSAMFTSLLNQ